MGWLSAIAKFLGLADFLARWAHDQQEQKTGIQKQVVADQAAELGEVSDAQKIRDRLRADPAYRDSVRDRFTEK